MIAAYKNYNIRIKGRIHDTGFRTMVETIGRSLNLRGMVYNDIDGTVKIVCGGAIPSVKSLIKELKDKSANVEATINEINQKEISGRVELPPYFFNAPTDELGDIERKLDLSIQSNQDIERNTDAISTKIERFTGSLRGLQKSKD